MTVWGWGSRLGHFWWQGVGRWFENTGCLCGSGETDCEGVRAESDSRKRMET